jgi:hypothetical protein
MLGLACRWSTDRGHHTAAVKQRHKLAPDLSPGKSKKARKGRHGELILSLAEFRREAANIPPLRFPEEAALTDFRMLEKPRAGQNQ